MTALLLDETKIRLALALWAAATPAVALAWLLLARMRRSPLPTPAWVALALAGPATLLLWTVYNGVIAVFDLDSLAGLGVNFALFTAAGLAAGCAWRRWRRSPPAALAAHLQRGRRGEALAARHIRRQGWRILARNYQTREGEIDLIAGDGDTVVFVEVKTRQSNEYGEPETAVDDRKRERIRAAARQYLRRFSRKGEPPACRFDIVAVQDGPLTSTPSIRHIKAAFSWQ